MKRIIISAIALFSIILLSSCRKDAHSNFPATEDSISYLSLNICGSGSVSTKVASQTENLENTINNVQVFVFNSSTGQLDNAIYKGGLSACGSYSMEPVKCTVGSKIVWAVVNAPMDYVGGGAVRKISDLSSLKVKLSDNGTSSLVMVGKGEVELAPGTSTYSIKTERLCAAVVLKEVANEIAVLSYASKVNLTGVYLMNVPSVQKMDGSITSDSEESVWNAFFRKAEAPEPVSLLVEKIGPSNIPFHAKHTQTHSFYTFSNIYDKVAFEGNPPFGKCSTYLVVECTIDDVPCVYPIVLPQLKANCKYNVSLKINHVGGNPDEPWKEINFNSFTPSISVEPWTEVSVSETI